MRAALIPPEPVDPLTKEVPASASVPAKQDDVAEDEKNEVASEKAALHTILPERVVIAPDDPGPEGADTGELDGAGGDARRG